MKSILTNDEVKRVRKLCFENPAKACAVAQIIADTCGLVSCSTFAEVKSKKVRAVQYKADRLNGVTIDNRRFVSINQ